MSKYLCMKPSTILAISLISLMLTPSVVMRAAAVPKPNILITLAEVGQ